MRTIWGVLTCVAIAAGCATGGAVLGNAELERKTQAMLLESFHTKGTVAQDRLQRDFTQNACAEYAGRAIPKDAGERIEKLEMSYVKFPADKQYLGDWRRGEVLAQSGRGLQFNDPADVQRGGNCYACHQISPEELSFGTIGPSLRNFGKLRGSSAAIQQYAFGKIYNAHAYAACSNMPRFGTMNILTEQEIKDLVALLVDPASPVNK